MSSGAEFPGVAAGPFDGEVPRRGGALHVDTAIFCGVVLLSGVAPGAAFIAVLTIPFVALWLLVQLVLAFFDRGRWLYLASKVVVLALVVAVLFGLQAIYRPLARHAADDAWQSVQAWHAAHSAWPQSLAEAGMPDVARAGRWHIMYFKEDGSVMYQSTFNGFDRWWRRPGDPDWEFQPD